MNFGDPGSRKGNDGSDSGGLFLKLKEGEKIKGVFAGDPHTFWQHWPKGDPRPTPCPDANCPLCEKGDKARMRFRINFLTKEKDVWVAKIWDQSAPTYYDLKEMHESGYQLDKTLVTISRQGDGKNTRYSIMPVPENGGMKPEHFQKLSKIPLNKLTADAESQINTEASDDDIPF